MAQGRQHPRHVALAPSGAEFIPLRALLALSLCNFPFWRCYHVSFSVANTEHNLPLQSAARSQITDLKCDSGRLFPPSPLWARPSDGTLARAKARGCIEGQCEQRLCFALIKFLFPQFCDSTFPTSVIYSRKDNDTTSSVWDGDDGGVRRSQGGLSPSARQKTSPTVSVRCGHLLRFLLCFIPEVTVSAASAPIFLTLFVQPWPAKPTRRATSPCAPFRCSQGHCWQQVIGWDGETAVGFLPLPFPSQVTSDAVRAFFHSYKNAVYNNTLFYGVSCLAAPWVFEVCWRKRLAFPPPEELRG